MNSIGRTTPNPASARFARGDLAALDALRPEVDALGLFCFTDERPLAGVAGFVDWRVCGAISRALEQNIFHGDNDEVMLLPARGRLAGRRVFLFGLGAKSEATADTMVGGCSAALDVMRRAGCRKAAIALPVSPEIPINEERFLEILTAEDDDIVEKIFV